MMHKEKKVQVSDTTMFGIVEKAGYKIFILANNKR
jgi:hypothetical protein